MNNDCLIGYTGFVGSTLIDSKDFKYKFNSKNIQEIHKYEYDTVYCAAPSAVKWKANKYPKEDNEHVEYLIDNLKKIKTDNFILFSTVDVYNIVKDVNEDSIIDLENSNTYGKNRKLIEDFVESNFVKKIIIRLPALFGKNLKKNYIFDLMNKNNIENINLNSYFQWYDISRLHKDVNLFIENKIEKVNISPEPIKTEEIVDLFFQHEKKKCFYGDNIGYNIKTKYYNMFSGSDGYSRTKEQVLKDFTIFFGV